MSKRNNLKDAILNGGKKPAALEFMQEIKNENEANSKTENAVLHNTEKKKKRTAFEFDEDFHLELKLFATKNKMKMIDVVTAAIQEYMQKHQ